MFKKIKITLLVLAATTLLLTIANLHNFLSLNMPIPAEILVVEEWIDYDYLPMVLKEFYRNDYDKIVIVGFSNYKANKQHRDKSPTNADLKARRLKILSNNKINIVVVNSIYTDHNKTLNYMIGFRDWLIKEFSDTKSVNLFTTSVHARKSYFILRKVLPRKIKVGVISAPPLQYNANFWWRSKRGLFLVLKNATSYIYTVLFVRI